MGIEIPYFHIIIKLIPLLLVLLLILKSNLRWQALFKARKIDAYNISKVGWKKCVVYEVFQWAFYSFIALLLFNYYEKGMLLVIVLVFYVIESISHVLIGRNLYKIIVREKAITIINNNIIVIPWNEIKGIVRRHNGLQFKLSNKTIRVLDQDLIEENQISVFNNQIKELAIEKSIFIDE